MRFRPQQTELFPLAAPPTVIAASRRLEAIVYSIAPELTPEECLQMLGELALAAMRFEAIASRIRSGKMWQARQALPPLETTDHPTERLEDARSWRSPVQRGWPFRR